MIRAIGGYLLERAAEVAIEKTVKVLFSDDSENKSSEDEEDEEYDEEYEEEDEEYEEEEDENEVSDEDDEEYDDDEAQIALGVEAFNVGNYQTAYSILSEYNDAVSLYCIGYMTYNGWGCNADKRSAIQLFHKSADMGDLDSQYELGLIYLRGEDIEANPPEAYKWFMEAAKQGHIKAQFYVGACFEEGECVKQSQKNAIMWYRKAAQQGDVDAQYRLGGIYLLELDDYPTAIEWIEKAIEQDSLEAHILLGCCYSDGLGVEVDPARAMELFKKAAEAGNIFAIANVGKCYEKFDKDYEQAMEWYQKAADQGDEEAAESIERCRELMNTESSDSTAINANEEEYRAELQEILADGEISASERRLLKKIQTQLGISDERASQIEESLYETDTITPEEQEYLEEFNECGEDGVLTASERRLLNRIRIKLGISEDRAEELENL